MNPVQIIVNDAVLMHCVELSTCVDPNVFSHSKYLINLQHGWTTQFLASFFGLRSPSNWPIRP